MKHGTSAAPTLLKGVIYAPRRIVALRCPVSALLRQLLRALPSRTTSPFRPKRQFWFPAKGAFRLLPRVRHVARVQQRLHPKKQRKRRSKMNLTT